MKVSKRPRPLLLIILDGWGERNATEGNAIKLANTPNLDRWRANYPWTLLQAAEQSVGLPAGQIGTSEVGHLNLGAGFIVLQAISYINDRIDDGSFFENDAFNNAIQHVKARNSRLHLIGLLGTGGVHSHLHHEKALLELAKRSGLDQVYIHCFTDGRDTMPKSASGFMDDLQSYTSTLGLGKVATVIGRYYAMDRDKRWERTQAAYNAMVYGKGLQATDAQMAIEQAYAAGITDEFIQPTVISSAGQPTACIQDGDTVICFNFRADRARQISSAFVLPQFDGFAREALHDLIYVAMREYERDLPVEIAFDIKDVEVPLAQVLSLANLTQLHVAETEKYAHVTYFFNGGREQAFPGEERVLVPSPKEVPTYDLKPEMSAYAIRDTLLKAIHDDAFDVMIINFANADMVGHTGVLPAVIKACEVIDSCLGEIIPAVLAKAGAAIITADHGNAELLIDPATGGPHTAHTTNPVPCILITANTPDLNGIQLRPGGKLADVAPTMLELLQIPQPLQMNGQSLLLRTGS